MVGLRGAHAAGLEQSNRGSDAEAEQRGEVQYSGPAGVGVGFTARRLMRSAVVAVSEKARVRFWRCWVGWRCWLWRGEEG